MHKPIHIKGTDVLGASRLAIEATLGMIGVAEGIHLAVLDNILPGTLAQAALVGSTASIYAAIRMIAGAVGYGLDAAVSPYASWIAGIKSTLRREAVLAALNGLVGDHLAATQNPLAIPMRLRRAGCTLEVRRNHLAAAFPHAGDKILLFVHGLCMNDLQWGSNGRNPGARLAVELGWTPVHLHYNSGLHVSTNGRALAGLLEKLAGEWPVPLRKLGIIGHSCGGLLARSAHYYGTTAGHCWPNCLRYLAFLGTPHHGSALERGGNFVNMLLGSSAYTSPFGRIARVRSAGITDMRFGNLIDAHWEGFDRFHNTADRRQPVPLPEGVRSFAIAANNGRTALRFGDGLVSVDSALGRHPDPARALSFASSDQCVVNGMTHWGLLRGAAVYRKLREWLTA